MTGYRRLGCGCFQTAGDLPSRDRRKLLGISSALVMGMALPELARAQERWNHGLSGTCSFYPNEGVNADVYTFGSPQEGLDVVKKITSSAGLQPNFQVLQANVPNAAAVIRDGQRYILYSQHFINQVKQQATEWAAWTIMAHEVGHHLNGHTLLQTGSRPPIELEADRFAGFAVNRMGGTLQQALSPYRQMSEQGSATHPPRSARLEAVTAGYHQAGPVPTTSPGPGPSPAPTPVNPASLLQSIIPQLQAGQMPPQPMTPQLRQAVQSQLAQVSFMLQQAGPVQQVLLQNQQPTPDGGTLYHFRVIFAAASTIWQLGIQPGGTLNSLWFQGQ